MNNLHPIAQAVQSQGRGKDTQLVHMTPNEVQGLHALAKAHGGSLSVNPSTGLPEAGFLDSMMPMLLGAGLAAATGGSSLMIGAGIGGLQYARTGSLEKGIMAGIGAYGGAGLAGGLMGAGATAASGVTAGLTPGVAGGNAAITAADFAAEQAAQQALAQSATTAAAKTTATEAAKNAGTNLALQQSNALASNTFGQNFSNLGGGLKSAFSDPTTFMKNYGGSGMDLAQYGGAALSGPLMRGMAPKDTGPLKSDNEQFQYTYNPNRSSEENLAAQRLANPGGELNYFNPIYQGPNRVRVAQGGLLSLAEGGMPDEYTYDPVTQRYTKKPGVAPTAPIAAVTPIGIDASGGYESTMTDAQFDQQQMQGALNLETARQALFGAPEVTGPVQQVDMSTPYGSNQNNSGFGTAGAPVYSGSSISDGSIANANASPDPIAALNESQGWTGGGGGYSVNPAADQHGPPAPAGTMSNSSSDGGLLALAAGGMARGGFVIPADVVSALGNGSTDAGLRSLKAKFGAVKHIKGKGDGLSDSINTSIDGRQPARVADGEAYIDPKTVAIIGKGDPKKGAQKLYAMMDKIRGQAHGKTTQQRKVDPRKVV